MVFNSLTFLAFLAVILALHHLPLPWSVKKAHLLIGSYVFYAAWNPPLVLLLMFSTVVDWLIARRMEASRTRGARKALLVVSLTANLGVLGFFKYGGFVLENVETILRAAGLSWTPPAWNIVLPVGISFYTFQTLSYTIDVYRGELKARPSLLDFALFVTFFPQLVAGPIVRARDFLPQLDKPVRASADQVGWGFALLGLGLFQKMILADAILAPIADRVFAAGPTPGFVDAWIGTFAFSGQIFFDFAAYSTCAIGLALMLGFRLTENFRSPYGAVGFSDFWGRWHISLSTWLRDYLYIPLGGNRRGPARTYVNLAATMLLGGLWHGASWHFVAWGGLHGAFLIAERALRGFRPAGALDAKRSYRFYGALLTYGLVCLTWVFFRASDLGAAFRMTAVMLTGVGGGPGGLRTHEVAAVLGVTAALLASHGFLRDRRLDDVWASVSVRTRSIVLAGLLVCLALAPGDDRLFIYFQF